MHRSEITIKEVKGKAARVEAKCPLCKFTGDGFVYGRKTEEEWRSAEMGAVAKVVVHLRMEHGVEVKE